MNLGLQKRSLAAALSAMVFAVWPAVAQGFDLGSPNPSVQVTNDHMSGPTTILVGGRPRTVGIGDHVTPAEFAALQQVLNSGAQALSIDASGIATGGRFALNQLPSSILAGLGVPSGVTAIHDFAGTLGTLNIAGNLANSGTFYAVSTNAQITTANLLAANIYNNANSLISSVLPVGGLPGYHNAIGNLNLNLSVLGAVVNAGTISSAGSLSITNQQPGDLFVNNTGGVLSAVEAINFGGPSTHNIRIVGGDLLSQSVNVRAADAVRINVGDLTGVLNVTAAWLNVIAATQTLRLDKICLSGDPLFANPSGSILLDENFNLLTNGEDLTIIARDDVRIAPTAAADIFVDTGGGNLSIIAGADFSVDPSDVVTINGASTGGGVIDLTHPTQGLFITTAGPNNTGNATFRAFAGATAGSGAIVMPKETVANAIDIVTSDLTNDGKIVGINTTIRSLPGTNLTIRGNDDAHSGQGALRGTSALRILSDKNVIFADHAHQSITGQTYIIANGDTGCVILGEGSVVHSHTPLTLFTRDIDFVGAGSAQGAIDGAPLKWVVPKGAGTMSNPDGDLHLTTNIIATGQHITLLAKGNITAKNGVTKIDVSNSKGQGGTVHLIAGYDFNEVGNVTTLTGQSGIGGSVLLPSVSINTTSKFVDPAVYDPDNGSGFFYSPHSVAGDVRVIATKGTENSGVIVLKDITARGDSFDAKGGDVLLIGEGGVRVNNVDTTGAFAGNVRIVGATPTILNGDMVFENGYVRSGAIFDALPVSGANGAAIQTGNITTTATFARAGNTTLTSDSWIHVKGNITARGQRSLQHSSNATAGGVVTLSSLTDKVTVTGSIDVSGTAKPNENILDDTGGANAGTVTIFSPSAILITGSIKATGAPTKSIADAAHVVKAGNGGTIQLTSTDETPNGLRGGSIRIGGYINARGASGVEAGGRGGSVTLNAGTVRVEGSLGGLGIDVRHGVSSTGVAPDDPFKGTIRIDTYATQPIPANFDLSSSKSSEVALPGGKFTVGIMQPIPGFAGIPNGIKHGMLARLGGTKLSGQSFIEGQLSTTAGINIVVHGSGRSISEVDNGGALSTASYSPHDLITPARAVALYQVSRSNLPSDHSQTFFPDVQTGVGTSQNPSGPGAALIRVDESHVRHDFTRFVLDGNDGGPVRFQVDGARPSIRLGASAVTRINGELAFSTSDAVASIDFGSKLGTGSKPLLLPAGSITTDSTGTLVLQAVGSKFYNDGIIDAGKLMFATDGPTFTFENLDDGKVQLNGPGSRAIISKTGNLPKLTFVNKLGQFDLPFSFESAQLPFSHGRYMDRSLPLSSIRKVDLAFDFASAPLLQGTVHGDTVKISATKDLTIDAAAISAGTLNAGVVPTTTLAKSDVLTRGSVSISTGTMKTAGTLTMNPGSKVTANGGDVKLTSFGSIHFSDPVAVTANGGNILALAKGNVLGVDTNLSNSTFTARAIGTTASSTGGGIEFASGYTTSTGLGPALAARTPSAPPMTQLGSQGAAAGTSSGFITYDNNGTGIVSVKGAGSVDLTTDGVLDASIFQRGGALVFSTKNNTDEINFAGVNIQTFGFKPVAYVASTGLVAALINPDSKFEYETEFGTINASKNSLLALESDGRVLRVKACSGPAQVSITVGDKTVVLNAGEELVLSRNPLSEAEVHGKDGIGRRLISTTAFASDVHGAVCEFSMVSFMSNTKYLSSLDRELKDKMLKTAAAIHVMSAGKKGAFSARAR